MKTRSLLFTLLLLSNSCFPESKIVCTPPEGLRVDYFNEPSNLSKYKNHVFLTDTDSFSGMHPTIIFEDNQKEVTFIIGNTSSAISKNMKGNMAIIYSSKDQISFAGVINEAPILASYYPDMHILVYSQQSDWMPTKRGMRSGIYFSRCSQPNLNAGAK